MKKQQEEDLAKQASNQPVIRKKIEKKDDALDDLLSAGLGKGKKKQMFGFEIIIWKSTPVGLLWHRSNFEVMGFGRISQDVPLGSLDLDTYLHGCI